MGLPGHADLRLQSVYRASAPGDLETFQKIASAIKEDTHIMIDGKGDPCDCGNGSYGYCMGQDPPYFKKTGYAGDLFRYDPWICAYGPGAGRRP